MLQVDLHGLTAAAAELLIGSIVADARVGPAGGALFVADEERMAALRGGGLRIVTGKGLRATPQKRVQSTLGAAARAALDRLGLAHAADGRNDGALIVAPDAIAEASRGAEGDRGAIVEAMWDMARAPAP